MIPDDRLQEILATKDHEAALASIKEHGHASECWSIIDGVLVVYEDAPDWLRPVLEAADEDGRTPEWYKRYHREEEAERLREQFTQG